MKESVEYQIFVGCNDPQVHQEIVSEQELREMVAGFFERKKIDFSMLSTRGGYMHTYGGFVEES